MNEQISLVVNTIRSTPSRAAPLGLALALVLAGCGGSSASGEPSTPPAAQAVEVAVSPGSSTVTTGGTVHLAAQVTGTAVTTVTWSVQETGGGSVSTSGTYTAPSTTGTYHVVAASTVAPTARGVATVTVTAAPTPTPTPTPVVVTVSPSTVTLDACRGTVLTAQVANATSQSVTWSIQEAGGGTVTNGIYTAPSTAGTYHVVATSVADGTARGISTITVGPAAILSVAVAPGSGTVQAGGQLAFAATVTTSCGTFAAQ